AGAATFALRLQDGIEDHLAATIEISIGIQFFVRQRILRADILAAAALEYEPDAGVGGAMLMKMEGGRAGPDVRAVVFAGQGIDRILAEITFLRRLFHGFARGFFEGDLVEADGAIDIKNNTAGVL